MAANKFPVKILKDIDLMRALNAGRVRLRHLQLCPTNKCNLNCGYCSCGGRDKTLELPFEKVVDTLHLAKTHGCRGITITGGGEPLLYPDIDGLVGTCWILAIHVGLVTNGILLDRVPMGVEWCRISMDGHREIPKGIEPVVNDRPEVDWAFSYILSGSLDNLTDVVRLANKLDFTHVRVVSDILNPSAELMAEAKRLLAGMDDRVIYQDRAMPTKGTRDCYISLLKPTIAADGKIYPCCGIQYARTDMPKDFTYDMGENLDEIIEGQKHYDGSLCERCYYSDYNELMAMVMSKVDHLAWV